MVQWYQKLVGGDGESKINFIQLWKQVILDKLKGDQSIYGPLKASNWYASNLAMYSEKDNVVFLYVIDGYPGELPISFRDDLRDGARGTVRVSFISRINSTSIEWNSAKMKSRLRTWQALDAEQDEIDAFNYRENVSQMDLSDRRKESLKYMADAELRQRRRLFKIESMILISGTRGEDFDKTNEAVLAYCRNMGIQITRITHNIPEYLKVFSPFSLQNSKVVSKEVSSVTMPDEIMARFNSYTQGKVGAGGMYMGTDIYSGYPVYKEMKRTQVDAENILVSAETGGGKSYYVKVMLLQFAGDPRFNLTIMDVEGDEYFPLAAYIAQNDHVEHLNMAEGRGAYFDPVEIYLTGDPELDKDMFSLSQSYTVTIFRTLLGSISNNEWANIIINDAVSKTYEDHGVYRQLPDTWTRSQGLTLFDVYASINEIIDEESEFEGDSDRRKALNLVKATLSRYFEPEGTQANVFSQRVRIEEIRDAKLLLCSFGMKGKAMGTVDPVQMGLTEIFAAMMSHLRSIMGQRNGLYSVKVWEEFQRWGQFPDSEKTITTAITGGRKLGDVNIIITNKPSDLLTVDRGFGIFENTTSFALGAIGDAKVRQELAERLSVEQLKPDLDLLVHERRTKESLRKDSEGKEIKETASTATSIYDKAFLVYLDKTDATLVRMELPTEISESQLFMTGVEIAEQETNGNYREHEFYQTGLIPEEAFTYG